MYEILLIAFLVVSVAIIGLVLIQHGKGADMGASFGAGASTTLFGSSGTGNFLTRTTSLLGLLFFVISLVLANLGTKPVNSSEFSNIEESAPAQQTQQIAPANKAPQTTQDTNPTSEIPD